MGAPECEVRSSEMLAISSCAELAAAGRVRLVLVGGSRESGKTWLLGRLSRLLCDKGFAVIHWDGNRSLESDLAHSLSEWNAKRSVGGDSERPSAIVVDGVRNIGDPTLRFLDEILNHPSSRRVLVVLSSEAIEKSLPDWFLARWMFRDRTRIVALSSLEHVQAVRLARKVLAAEPDEEFIRESVWLTAGVLGRLVTLWRTVHSEGLPPTARSVPSLARISYRHLTDLYRAAMAGLAPPAREVLVATAVLDDLAQDILAGLIRAPAHSTARHLARLRIEGFLPADGRPPHPVVRASILGTVSAADLDMLHARAARLLDVAARPPGDIARQLAHLARLEEPWMHDVMRQAALATERSDPCTSARYSTLLLQSQTSPEDRARTLFRLAGTLALHDPRAAMDHLNRALEEAPGAFDRSETARLMAGPTMALGRVPDIIRELWNRPAPSDRAPLVVADDSPLRGASVPTSAPAARPGRESFFSPPEDAPKALDVLREVVASGSADQVAQHAQQVLASGTQDPNVTCALVSCLFRADLAPLAERVYAGAMEEARLRGDKAGQHVLLRWSVYRWCELGRLNDASEDLRRLRRATPRPTRTQRTFMRLLSVRILAAQDKTEAADRLLGTLSAHQNNLYLWVELNHERACALSRAGDHEAASRLLSTLMKDIEEEGMHTMLLPPRWYDMVRLEMVMGRAREARHLLTRIGEVAARWGTKTAMGQFLLCAGLAAAEPDTAVELLTEADALLAESPSVVSRARVKVHLGKALLDAGSPVAARRRLREAVVLTEQHGAYALRATAATALVAAGGRLTRVNTDCAVQRLLTRSEFQVARLAAEGRSNQEIADELHLVLRTVESHLTCVYRKLGIRGRKELREALVRAAITQSAFQGEGGDTDVEGVRL